MAVKFVTKEKAAQKVAEAAKPKSAVEAETTEIVERLAEIAKAIEGYKALDKEYKELREKLMARFPLESKVSEEVVFKGDKHKVVFSPAAVERKVVNKTLLIEKLTPTVFVNIAEVKLGDIDKYLSAEEQKGIIEANQTGSRKMAIKEA